MIAAAVLPHGDFAYDPKLVNDTGGRNTRGEDSPGLVGTEDVLGRYWETQKSLRLQDVLGHGGCLSTSDLQSMQLNPSVSFCILELRRSDRVLNR